MGTDEHISEGDDGTTSKSAQVRGNDESNNCLCRPIESSKSDERKRKASKSTTSGQQLQ